MGGESARILVLSKGKRTDTTFVGTFMEIVNRLGHLREFLSKQKEFLSWGKAASKGKLWS